MRLLRRFLMRLTNTAARRRDEERLKDEIEEHLALQTTENIRGGMPPTEARRQAVLKFGGVEAVKEEYRAEGRMLLIETLVQDVRYGLRTLRKSPGFTLLAIITLSLGIGVNTAMFSGLNSILLKPLPYPDSAQLDRIDRATPQNHEGRVSSADFLDLRREMHAYGEIGAYALGDTSLSEPGQPAEMVPALRITSNLLSILRVQPQLGRDFLPREDMPGTDRVVIISQHCWQQRFGGRSDVIGRTIRVDGEPHEIVGVLPAWFNDWRHLGGLDLFRPLALDQQKSTDRRSTILRLIGRRSDKLSRAEADGFIVNFGARLATDFPEVNAGSTWRVVPLDDTVRTKNGFIMLEMLIGLSGFVLLIACSNLANLLLARTMARSREFAVRSALGASRVQLLRPLIAESLFLALAGGVSSVVVARWAVDWLSYKSIDAIGDRIEFAFDWHVFGWAFVASVVTAVAFGVAPALFALRLNVNDTLKSGARGMTGGRGHQRFRNILIVGQFALAMVLLAGAALFVRGLDELNSTRAGWHSEHLVTGTFVLPSAGYPDADRIAAFQRVTVERLEAVPGVASASICSFTPFFNWADIRKYLIEGRELPKPGHEPAAVVNSVSPHYFDTFGTRLLSGRVFNERDSQTSPKVFIISQAMATGLFGNENPIGRRLAQPGIGNSQWGEIVGVAADVKSIMPDPGPVTFQLYQPMAQEPRPYNQIAVRTTGVAPSTLLQSIRNVMTELDADLPVRQLEPGDTTIERANSRTAVLRDMLTSFAVLGLGLASLGIYGVIARTMAQRTGEFAIRVALGARGPDITYIVLASGVKLALMGSVFGGLGALGVSRVLAARNPGMHLNSPPVLIGTTLLLIAVALVACWVPARRAARINPVDALRAE